jgi:hypothetical protein
VAYTSNESGTYEVRVRNAARSGRKWQVSKNGGYEPRWRGDGGELYFLSADRKLMAVAASRGPAFEVPHPLFQTQARKGVNPLRTHFVPDRDGQRFLIHESGDEAAMPITVVPDWTAGRKK